MSLTSRPEPLDAAHLLPRPTLFRALCRALFIAFVYLEGMQSELAAVD